MSNADFDLFRTSEDHEELRAAVRNVADNKIAPYAAEVDDKSEFPQAAYDALVASDFHAPHVPEEYDGVGADALATCIVIEEVARACASSSLIPAVNKLGSLPLILGGSEELKRRYLPALASGAAGFSYGLSERDAGSDTAAMKTRAKADGDDFILSGQKSWITNAGFSDYYTVLAVTDPEAGRGKGISAFVVEKSDEGFTFGEKERKLGIKGSPTRELLFDDVRIPGDRMIGAPGTGLALALQDAGPHPRHHRRPGRRHRPGRPGLRAGLRQGAPAVRQADRRLPGHPVHARRHGDEPRGRPPDGLRRRRQVRAQVTPTCRSSALLPSATPPTSPCRSPPTPSSCSVAPATPPTSRSSG